MKAIVVVDKHWGIGKDGGLLFRLKKDMANFRQTTLGKVVCMGRRTLLSFPNGKPLVKRTNIVLSSKGVDTEGCIVVPTLDKLFEELKKYPSEEIYIIGGAIFYHTMLPYVDSVIVTKVEANGNADVYFDNLDSDSNWEQVYSSEPMDDNGYTIRFTEYKNLNKKIYGE